MGRFVLWLSSIIEVLDDLDGNASRLEKRADSVADESSSDIQLDTLSTPT